MNQTHFKALGLMSGTSLDGLDIALVAFQADGSRYTFTILKTETLAYNERWFTDLKNAHLLDELALKKLDAAYGAWLGEVVQHFILNNKIDGLDFIASHGHTVHHQPEKKITVQIGNGPQLAAATGLPVVCDFRLQDVLLGGQGAPLVPIGDELLFADFDACLNLGGFANISFAQHGQRIAFDVCAANIVLNYLAQKLCLAYDDGGAHARSGTLLPELLAKLNSLPYFGQQPPKSLGREWTDAEVLPLLEGRFATEDLLHTFCIHIANQIAMVCRQAELKTVLVTGGGAFNLFLMELLNAGSETKFILPEGELITHKEALIFAFLGLLRWLNQPNCLASVTGAPANHSAGRIYKLSGR
jgi:anhydro-N-acetylmuramic acid kinase